MESSKPPLSDEEIADAEDLAEAYKMLNGDD